jgi:hypothetical protein
MIASFFVVAMWLSVPIPAQQLDTISPVAVGNEATSAPTDSIASWQQRAAIDARLIRPLPSESSSDTLPRRRRAAIDYSDWYYRRLQVHRWGSYVELPVFAAEYWLGNKLISRSETPGSWVKPTHVGVAATLGGLFAVNTVTGIWNLYDSRKDTEQRALVWSHSGLMLAADAGFAVTGLIAGDAHRTTSGANRHRDAALTSMGLATAGTLLMWVKRGLW